MRVGNIFAPKSWINLNSAKPSETCLLCLLTANTSEQNISAASNYGKE